MTSAARLPWVKVCGVTRPEDAELAARLGARFVGVNFWSGSKRSVDVSAAREITNALAGVGAWPHTELVGVFVNEDPERIEELAAEVGLDRVQLHGDEPGEIVARFGVRALRALRADGPIVNLASMLDSGSRSGENDPQRVWDAALETAGLTLQWRALAVLLDSGNAGARYGGTGETWDWTSVRGISARSPIPILIAGGVDPSNAGEALAASGASGVDVASGVESSPGIKDREKMERLFEEVARARPIR